MSHNHQFAYLIAVIDSGNCGTPPETLYTLSFVIMLPLIFRQYYLCGSGDHAVCLEAL